MEKGTLITLDDNSEYALLDTVTIDKKKFYYAVKVDSTTGNPMSEHEIFEEYIDGDDVYMDIVEEGDFKQKIIVGFTNNYMLGVKNEKD